ncbi:GNAT family N-acetyltransferase [Herbidospora daliensis]|uniref:GNAT family N-acetyltransferase n=1 Tax=Herbidospora daliensis TaxID=295585 RepID=UPI0018DD6FB9|nr:GNAT family N-acetyltransferase [Herbidospora daliensis]
MLRAPARGRRPVYCSRACQARAYRSRRDPPVPAPAEPEPAGRRRQIVEAVWRIAAGRGLQMATVREIAAEAGVSPRVVQYHFAGKHDLLVTALRMLHRDNEGRARERIAALRDPADPRAVLRATLEELLPLDDQRQTGLRVLTAYYARSLTDPALAEVFLPDDSPLEDLVAALITAAGPKPSIDAAREADLLVGGVSGLGLDLLHGRRTKAEVGRTVDYHLARILAEWVLRPASPDDVEAVAELRAVVLRADLERLGRYDGRRVRQRLRDGFVPGHTWTIEVGGAFAGCVAMRPDGDVVWLEHFYLDPAHQGRGIGSAVLDRLLERCDRDRVTVRLNVLRGSPARRLYERRGFTLDTEDDVDVFMTRRPE